MTTKQIGAREEIVEILKKLKNDCTYPGVSPEMSIIRQKIDEYLAHYELGEDK